MFDTCAGLLCDSEGTSVHTIHQKSSYLTVQFASHWWQWTRETKIRVFNRFQYRYPFQCFLVLHFEGLRHSFAVGVGGHLDEAAAVVVAVAVVAAAVVAADDAEESSLLHAYSCQELQNLAPAQPAL